MAGASWHKRCRKTEPWVGGRTLHEPKLAGRTSAATGPAWPDRPQTETAKPMPTACRHRQRSRSTMHVQSRLLTGRACAATEPVLPTERCRRHKTTPGLQRTSPTTGHGRSDEAIDWARLRSHRANTTSKNESTVAYANRVQERRADRARLRSHGVNSPTYGNRLGAPAQPRSRFTNL